MIPYSKGSLLLNYLSQLTTYFDKHTLINFSWTSNLILSFPRDTDLIKSPCCSVFPCLAVGYGIRNRSFSEYCYQKTPVQARKIYHQHFVPTSR